MPSYSFKNSGSFLSGNSRALSSWNNYILNFPYNTYNPKVAFDSNDNMYIVTNTPEYMQSGNPQPGAHLLVKLNKYGATEWKKRIFKSSNYTSTEAFSITFDSNTNTIIIGGRIHTGSKDYQGFLLKVDTNGNTLWSKQYQANSTFQFGQHTGIATDSSGNIYAVSQQEYAASSRSNALLKFNSSGDFQWIRYRYDNSSTGEGNWGVKVDSNGDIVCIGVGYDTSGRTGSILTKFNQSGTIIFAKNLYLTTGMYKQSSGYSIAIDSSNNYFTAGSYYDTGTDPYICKYDSSGTLQWQRTLRGISDADCRLITVDSSNSVYVAFHNNFYLYVIKMDTNGTVTWARRLYAASQNGFSTTYSGANGLVVRGNTIFLTASHNGVGPFVDGVFTFQLPTDGSKTGTFVVNGYTFTYESTSVTNTTRSASFGNATTTTYSAVTFTTSNASLVVADNTNAEVVSSSF